MNSTIRKRILQEIKNINNENCDNIKASPKSDSNIFDWTATIKGPDNSPYENGYFILDIAIPSNYPFNPPKINFHSTDKMPH